MSESSSTPRRGRFRFLYQFSLRTLLLVTAAVAIFCNWYFQPKYHEEELAGKDLRVRQQMKSRGKLVSQIKAVAPTSSGIGREPINHGHWTLLDGDDFVLSRGHFVEGEESGRWVTYYPTGHKAAEGKMHSGVKVGLWRTWYEDGTLASEVSYRRQPLAQEERYRDYMDWSGRPFRGSGIHPDKVVDPHTVYLSLREGAAKAWYTNSQLKFEGAFQADQQQGDWTFYDEQGRVTARGSFRDGKRHGEWTLSRSVSDVPVGQVFSVPVHSRGEWATWTVHYIDGRTEAELTRLLCRLEKQLESGRPYRRRQALIDLADIGEGAVPLLQKRLADSNQNELVAVLAVLPRMKKAAAPLLTRIRELAKSGEPTTAHQARLTLFQLDADARDALYAGLVADAIAAPSAAQSLRELVLLYHTDSSRQAAVFAELMSLPVKRSDADGERIAEAITGLGGDVSQHILAALTAPSERVRLQGVKSLKAILQDWSAPRTYVDFDPQTWESLMSKLKHDSSSDVRAAAEELFQPVMGSPVPVVG